MTSFTLKNVPDQLLDRVRERASDNRRSMTQEILHLLERALDNVSPDPLVAANRQADAWAKLAGRWVSDETRAEEIEHIYASRTLGREFDF